MKEDYYNKLARRINQRAKLLVANPNFQADLKEMRRVFNIPDIGLKDQRSTQKWYRDFYESDNKYLRDVWGKRHSEIVKLNKAKKFREAIELREELNNAMPINAFRIAIKNLIKKYKLPLNWHGGIKEYVLSNDIEKARLPGGIVIRMEYDEDTGLRTLCIEIQDDTRIEDIKKAWPSIMFHQSLLNSHTKKKFQPIKRFERDKKAYDLKRSGKTYSEIANILSGGDDESVSYVDVASYIKRYKQKVGIN